MAVLLTGYAPSIKCGRCGTSMGHVGDRPVDMLYRGRRFVCLDCVRKDERHRQQAENLKKARRAKGRKRD